MRLPGPPELLPRSPDAVIDLQTHEGAALVSATWRYADAHIEDIDFVSVGDDLGPSGPPDRTYDVVPHAEAVDFDDSSWRRLEPPETMLRLGNGRVSFNWYRLAVTIPDRIGGLDPTGATAVFEIVVDDYAEIWINGELPIALGDSGGAVVGGFNTPNRVVLTRDARPGDRFQIAVFGINGPVSASPRNYIWIRSATLDVYAGDRARVTEDAALEIEHADPALEQILPRDVRLQRVATGFEFTEGPVWTRDGALLFSSPNTNSIYRWRPDGTITVFRPKSGYTGVDIGDYTQPGSNGLTFDPDGRLVICQHGNRRLIRVEPRGNVTVLADSFDGKRLNSPNDVACRADGTLYFTDPPFGLPGHFDDPKKELSFSGVFGVRNGEIFLVDDSLAGPNGIAVSPDGSHLYVGNWDPESKIVVRYDLDENGRGSYRTDLFDMTDADGEDAIDGMKVDLDGNLYVCGPSGIWIIAADGTHLGTLRLPEAPHNLAWGDDGSTLYVTAMTSVYRVRLNTHGVRPG